MIKADELYDINYLNKLDVTIMEQVIKGHSDAEVTYLFNEYTLDEIDFIKQALLDHGYALDEINLFADNKHVGVVLEIFW